MIKTIQGNVLDIPTIYICHQVNCKGVMGAGLAKQIKEKWDTVFRDYNTLCIYEENLLGSIGVSKVMDNVYVINMFAQDGYGRDKCYTDYKAFESCLLKIASQADREKDIIRFPYKIGCGLAGGDWNIIQQLIYKHLNEYNVEFYNINPDEAII